MSLDTYIATIEKELQTTMNQLHAPIYEKAVELIEQAEQAGNRLHITGIGKPSYVGAYTASLLASTGTPTYVLDGTEAVHGSSGQVRAGDVVIGISNSGETEELLRTMRTVQANGAKTIAVTGNDESALAKIADCCLLAKVCKEGGPMNRAPRASILVELVVLQGLSVILQERKKMSPVEYVQFHPGGALGKLRESEV